MIDKFEVKIDNTECKHRVFGRCQNPFNMSIGNVYNIEEKPTGQCISQFCPIKIETII